MSTTAEEKAYQDEMAAKVKKVKAEVESLQAEMEGKKAGMVGDLLKNVRQRTEDMSNMLDELKATSGAAFTATKEQLGKAWNEFESSFEEAKEKAKEKAKKS